jgi:exosome complex RNA-binding protein Rrp4
LDIVAAADPEANPKSLDEVREVVAKVNLLGEEMKRTLLVLRDEAVGDLKKGRQSIE